MTLADVTLLTPLYRSARMLPFIRANVADHLAAGGHAICSDRHGLDDAGARLRDEFGGTGRFHLLTADDGADWVANANALLRASRTPFQRLVPHDDSVAAADTARLVEPLRADPSLVLSHGPVEALALDGTRLPARDHPRDRPASPARGDAHSAALFWDQLYAGAFKAVVRRPVADGTLVTLRPTPTLAQSERCWLFALSLLGGFHFRADAPLRKRFWDGSASSGWTRTDRDPFAAAHVMAGYVADLVPEADRRAALTYNLFLNAARRARADDGLGRRLDHAPPFPHPGFGPAPLAKGARSD